MRSPIQSFGSRIRAFRQARNLTQGQLATLAGIDQAQLSRMETGLVEGSPSQLTTIAQLLGVTTSDLLGDKTNEEATGISYSPLNVHEQIRLDDHAPMGLKMLAEDIPLVNALAITDYEWVCLSSTRLPKSVSKHGYLQLLATIRVFEESEGAADSLSQLPEPHPELPETTQS